MEPETTNIKSRSPNDGQDAPTVWLGCGLLLAIPAFFIWVLFFRTPDPEWTDQVDAYAERQNIRKENARLACDRGVQSACVEYAEMID